MFDIFGFVIFTSLQGCHSLKKCLEFRICLEMSGKSGAAGSSQLKDAVINCLAGEDHTWHTTCAWGAKWKGCRSWYGGK